LIHVFVRAAAFGATLLASQPASAAECAVYAQGVNFGTFDPLTLLPLDGVGNIRVSCATPVGFSVSLSSGSGTIEARKLTSGSAELYYNLFTSPALAVVWGDGISGESVSASGQLVDLPIYGRVPAPRNAPAGSYIDTVTVTISY
jgi:spore coat protein U-like protein